MTNLELDKQLTENLFTKLKIKQQDGKLVRFHCPDCGTVSLNPLLHTIDCSNYYLAQEIKTLHAKLPPTNRFYNNIKTS